MSVAYFRFSPATWAAAGKLVSSFSRDPNFGVNGNINILVNSVKSTSLSPQLQQLYSLGFRDTHYVLLYVAYSGLQSNEPYGYSATGNHTPGSFFAKYVTRDSEV